MQTLSDWLTDWHIDTWCWDVGCRWLVRLHCAESAVDGPTKWKSRTVSMSIQAIYQSCLEIGQPIDSLRQSVRHSVSPPLAWFGYCNWLCHAFLTFYWLSRQLAEATDCGNWQQASGNSDAHNASMLHPLKCKYLTTFLSSRPCLAGLGFTNTEYSNLKLTSCMWTEHSTNIGLLFKYTWRVPVPLFVFVFVAFSYSQAYPVCSTHSIEYMIEYECTPDPQTERLTHKTTDW